MTLSNIQREYEAILHSNDSNEQKAVAYAQLMDKLEQQYNIPMLRKDSWEQENKLVINLYRKIARSRQF